MVFLSVCCGNSGEPKDLLASLDQVFPKTVLPSGNNRFREAYKNTLEEFEGILQSSLTGCDASSLEETFLDKTVQLIGESEGLIPGERFNLDTAIVSGLAWGLLDWALNQLEQKLGTWTSTNRSFYYNAMRKYSIEIWDAMTAWEKRLMAKIIQRVAKEGFEEGRAYALGKCRAKWGTLDCGEKIMGLLSIRPRESVGIVHRLEVDQEMIGKIENDLFNVPHHLPVESIQSTERELVGSILKIPISSILVVVRLLDAVKERLEQVSGLKEENWVSFPEVAFFQIGARWVHQHPEDMDDFSNYVSVIWEPETVDIPPTKPTKLGSTFDYYMLVKSGREGEFFPKIPPLRKPFVPIREDDVLGHSLIQAMEDRMRSAELGPYLVYKEELFVDNRGEYQVIAPILPPEVAREDVLIEGVAGHPDWVMKWGSTCKQKKSGVADIVRDFWFGQIASKLQVSQQMYYLSPPGKYPLFKPSIAHFTMYDELYDPPMEDDYAWEDCARQPYSAVRFIVMERIQFTVGNLVEQQAAPRGLESERLVANDGLRFQTALVMAISIVKKLKALHNHENPIVHGDIHMGNIAVKNFDTYLREANFVLIDFGKSFFNEEFEGQSPRGNSWGPSCVRSVFNYQGFRASFRDDVYRALLAAAFLMNKGDSLLRYCQSMKKKINALIQFHGSEFVFDPLYEKADIVGIAFPLMEETERSEIRSHLGEALSLARSVKTVDEKPEYDGIIHHLETALQKIPLDI